MRNPYLYAGLALVTLFVVVGLFAPYLAPHGPNERFLPYGRPSLDHPLGTNDMGNDILSVLMFSCRVSLLVGFGAAAMAVAIGLAVGMLAGYYGGYVDEVLMGITDVVMILPKLPLIILVGSYSGGSLKTIVLIIGLLWWTSTARLVRPKVLQLREMEYVAAARTLGFSDRWVMLREILPNMYLIVIPKYLITAASALISEVSLSFLGLGDPSWDSWGLMIHMAFSRGGFVNRLWAWVLSPSACIVLFIMGLMFLAMGIERREMVNISEVLS
jgi:peptide/nickel transport system permease protein